MKNSNIPKLLKKKSRNFKYNSKRNKKITFRKKNALKVPKYKSQKNKKIKKHKHITQKHKRFIGGAPNPIDNLSAALAEASAAPQPAADIANEEQAAEESAQDVEARLISTRISPIDAANEQQAAEEAAQDEEVKLGLASQSSDNRDVDRLLDQSPDRPPQPGDLPPQPGDLPAQPGDLPVQPGDLPAQPGDLPPQPGDLPAQPGDLPAQPGDLPPQPGDLPAQPGDLPAQPGDLPAQPGDLPAQPSDLPPQPAPPPAPPPAQPPSSGNIGPRGPHEPPGPPGVTVVNGMSVSERNRLIQAAEKTVGDIVKALGDANETLAGLKAMPIEKNISKLKPPPNTYPKQYTIGFILPANTEFAKLPQQGISPESYFADLVGNTITRPIQLSSMQGQTSQNVAVVNEPSISPQSSSTTPNIELQGLTPLAQHNMTPIPQ